jgi:hypothetical protein
VTGPNFLSTVSYPSRSLQRYLWQTLAQIDCAEIHAAQIDTFAVRAAHDVQLLRSAIPCPTADTHPVITAPGAALGEIGRMIEGMSCHGMP